MSAGQCFFQMLLVPFFKSFAVGFIALTPLPVDREGHAYQYIHLTLSGLQSALQLGPTMHSGPSTLHMVQIGCTSLSGHLLHIIVHCNFVFNSPHLRGAALIWELLGLYGDNNEPLFVTAYHYVIVILPMWLSIHFCKTILWLKFFICCTVIFSFLLWR